MLVPPKLLQVDLSSIIFSKRRSMPIPNVHHQDLCNLFNSGYSCDHPSGLVWSLDWLITWLHASSFLRKSFQAPNSKISESLPISKFGSVSIENESALLSTLAKTLSAKNTLTLQKWNLRQTISGVFCCPTRQHEKRKGVHAALRKRNDQRSGKAIKGFGLGTSSYLWLPPMVKFQREGNLDKRDLFQIWWIWQQGWGYIIILLESVCNVFYQI